MSHQSPVKETELDSTHEIALRIVNRIFEISLKLRLDELETLCRSALGAHKTAEINNNGAVVNSKSTKGMNIFNFHKSNHSVRFHKPDGLTGKIHSSIFGPGPGPSRDYEDVTSPDILNAPIIDIILVQPNDVIPIGFYRISLTPSGKKADLNSVSGGNSLYLCIKKDITGQQDPITGLAVIYHNRGEYLLPGFNFVKRAGTACDLNSGTNFEKIFLCYKKEKFGNPIFDIQPLFPSKNESIPPNFFYIDRTTKNFEADLNLGTNGPKLGLSYRQSMRKLCCLSADTHPPIPIQIQQRGIQLLNNNNNNNNKNNRNQVFGPNGTSHTQRNVAARTQRPILTLHRNSRSSSDLPFFNHQSSSLASPITSTSISMMSSNSPKHIHKSLSRRSLLNSPCTDTEPDVDVDVEDVSLPRSPEASVSEKNNGLGKEVAQYAPSALHHNIEFENDDFYIEDNNEYTNTNGIDNVNGTGNGTGTDRASREFTIDSTMIVEKYTDVVLNTDGTIVDREMRKILHPLLVALYVRHSSLFDVAITGLQVLLKTTNFFSKDLQTVLPLGYRSMLDITIDAVCDRFDAFVDTQSESLLNFIQCVIETSKGVLSIFSLQRIVKTLTLICACHATDPQWLAFADTLPCHVDRSTIYASRLLCDLVRMLLDKANTVNSASKLPGGSCMSLLCTPRMYDLNETTSAAAVTTTEHHGTLIFFGLDDTLTPTSTSSNYNEVYQMVLDLVDDATDSVETAALVDRIHLFVKKHLTSTASPTFWNELGLVSKNLFVHYEYQAPFVVLAALCKISSLDIRHNTNGEARDLGNKLFALDAIREFCSSGKENVKRSKTVGYLMRRLVVPTIVNNITFGLKDTRVFTILLQIMTALWRFWRDHIKMEFAILCEQLAVRMLHLDATLSMYKFQLVILDEVKLWFELPHLLLEMYVNYDSDRDLIAHWNVFQNLTRAVCNLAGREVKSSSHPLNQNMSTSSSSNSNSNNSTSSDPILEVTLRALEVAAQISKALMDASGHAHLLVIKDVNMQERSLVKGGGWETDDDIPSFFSKKLLHQNSVRFRREKHAESAELLQQAIKIYHEKASLIKAVNFLVSSNYMADSPSEIASFLLLYKSQFDPSAIGELLGEGGRNAEELTYWSQVRYRYARATNYTDMTVEQGLRKYLTTCGFRLPGESQRADRLIEAFAKVFWQDNRGTPFADFKHQDTVYVLSFAVILLNTELHKKRDKKNPKMSKEAFISNLRDVDKDKNNPADKPSSISRDYLGDIYDNILKYPIELAVTSSESKDNSGDSDKQKETVKFNKEVFISNIIKTFTNSDDLLRDLSKCRHRFLVTGHDTNISLDMVRVMFENVWNHFNLVTDSRLVSAVCGLSCTNAALDILKYVLVSCIFLDMQIEKIAFATQLAKFKQWLVTYDAAINTNNIQKIASSRDVLGILNHRANFARGTHENETWFNNLSSVTPESAMDVVSDLHVMIFEVKETFTRLSALEILRNVANRIDKKASILKYNTSFIREGDLDKVSSKGKMVTYRFFLFSDVLLYAHHEILNGYKVHLQLELNKMQIHEVVDDKSGCCLYIEHPTKSFIVAADSPAMKQTWVRDLTNAITNCISAGHTNVHSNQNSIQKSNSGVDADTNSNSSNVNKNSGLSLTIENLTTTFTCMTAVAAPTSTSTSTSTSKRLPPAPVEVDSYSDGSSVTSDVETLISPSQIHFSSSAQSSSSSQLQLQSLSSSQKYHRGISAIMEQSSSEENNDTSGISDLSSPMHDKNSNNNNKSDITSPFENTFGLPDAVNKIDLNTSLDTAQRTTHTHTSAPSSSPSSSPSSLLLSSSYRSEVSSATSTDLNYLVSSSISSTSVIATRDESPSSFSYKMSDVASSTSTSTSADFQKVNNISLSIFLDTSNIHFAVVGLEAYV
eukprot:gene8580-17701_t